MLSKVSSTLMLPSPVSVFGTWKRGARLQRLHPAVEVVDVDVEELAIGDRRQRLRRLARQIGQHAHHEGQLNLLLRAVQLDVVLDLHARRAIARDELLTARLWPRTTSWPKPVLTGYSPVLQPACRPRLRDARPERCRPALRENPSTPDASRARGTAGSGSTAPCAGRSPPPRPAPGWRPAAT